MASTTMKLLPMSIENVISEVTIQAEITGIRKLRFRMWIAAGVLSLAIRILGPQAQVQVTIL